MRTIRTLAVALTTVSCAALLAAPAAKAPAPRARVVVISLDGARPALVEGYLKSGVLEKRSGLGRLRTHGVHAEQSITATPSVTAVSHIAIATGSTAAHNDISGNSIHPVAGTLGTSLSGFGAPIGGYQIAPLGPTLAPTAEPMWVQLRRFGRKVVTATWPGGDGIDVRVAGTVVQTSAPTRVTDYSVPFGAFGGLGAQGFTLGAAQFELADGTLTSQLAASGRGSFSPIHVTTNPVETIFCAPAAPVTCGSTNAQGRTLRYDIKAAALDTTNDQSVNYDMLVFFNALTGIAPGPLPFRRPGRPPAVAAVGALLFRRLGEQGWNRVLRGAARR